MCGICGLVYVHSDLVDRQTLEHELQTMCAAMQHRGPDDSGMLCQGNIGLAMRRLSVIDLTTGSQPIYNEDGQVGIVFNGEIYNYLKLRGQLVALGHQFRTTGDTEVIVHAYEEYGVECIRKLNGMFAFALWDGRRGKGRLLLARDRTGQKPLFYHFDQGRFTFASEIKALLSNAEVPRIVNFRAIYHYLSLQYIPSPETIFKSVMQLPGAHYAILEEGKFALTPYWTPSYEPKVQHTEAEWMTLTRQTVIDAVKRHLVSDVPLGAFLSGGVDSSIIVAAMAELTKAPIKTFSIGFDVAAYNETDHARRIATRFNTEHHEFIVTTREVTDALDAMVWYADQPLADTSCLATFHLAHLARQHVTVALSGDGGDEAFAGYTRYWLDYLLRVYRLLPATLRQKLIPRLAALIPQRVDVPTDRSIAAAINRLAQASSISPKASILAWGSFFSPEQKAALGAPDWLAQIGSEQTVELLVQRYDTAQASTHLDKTLSVDLLMYLVDDLLVKADRMSMAHSLEMRAPFLDNEVIELTSKMPEALKIRGRTQKDILRQAFADWLPAANVKRIKRGFGMPVGAWMRNHLRSFTTDVLLDKRTQERGYFMPKEVARLLEEHQSGQHDHGQRLWALLVLELWHRHYIDEATPTL